MDLLDQIERPLGEVTVRPFGPDGKPLVDPLSIFADLEEAKAFGLKDCGDGSIAIGNNLVVDSGRQVIANLLGGKDYDTVTPNKDWQITKVSWGTYDEAPRFTDVGLSPQPTGANEIELSSGVFKKAIASVDWPAAFIVRFECVLSPEEANGQLIREMGLWTENLVLMARKTLPAISKSADFGLSFLWSVRA